jgi:hypothetical protein
MVCWLIEEEQIGWQQSKDRQLKSAPFTTGQNGNLLINITATEEEARKVRARLAEFNWYRCTQRLNHRCPVQPCRTNLCEIARDHTGCNLDLSAERREDPSDALEERRFSSTIWPHDPNALSTAQRNAARCGDCARRRLSVPDDRLNQTHRLGGSATSTGGGNRQCCATLRRDHRLNRREARLMLVHLSVLPVTPIRLNQLLLPRDLFRPSLSISVSIFLFCLPLLGVRRVVPAESCDCVVPHLPDPIDDRIEEGTVVARYDERPSPCAKRTFKPLNRLYIQVVRWLVEQE